MELRVCVDSLACVRIKVGVSERFRIDSEVRQGCRVEIGRLPGLLYADDLVLFGES